MTDHAHELRRHARKIPHPHGETPGVMLRAADEIERLRAENAGVVDKNIKLRAMIQVALVVLDEVCGNINPERGYADELETDVKRAIAALSLYNAIGE